MPRQAIPLSSKNKEWREQSLDGVIARSSFDYSFTRGDWKEIVARCYEYYNGEIAPEDYAHVLKPYGKTRNNMPGKLRNYNILKPNADLLLGEYSRRPDNYTVIVTNPDVNTIKEEKKRELVMNNLKELFMKEVQATGVADLGVDPEAEAPMPEQVEKAFDLEYSDARAIQGQNALQYVEYSNEVSRLHRKGWKDFLIAGMVFSLKEVISNEVHYEILNPLDVDFDMSPDLDFVEDGDWAIVRKKMHPSQVVDLFYDKLTTAQVRQIETPTGSGEMPMSYQDHSRYTQNDGRLVDVCRVFWKSFKKIGILHYKDEYDEFQMTEVDEEYKKKSGERLDWYWVSEVWEGTRIEKDIYIQIRPFPVQRTSLDNPSRCKLPINGKIYSNRNAAFTSFIQLGIPYQLLYNIYHYRLESAVAKAKGVIAQLDLDYVPKGWDMDKYMYFIEATGIAWQQRKKEGNVMPTHTHREVLDLSVKAVDSFLSLIQMVKMEWEEISGVSRQRKGSMSQYDGKGVSEQSIVQSSLITEDLYEGFDEFKERDRAGLLDLSRMAFVSGKKGQFVLPDGAQGWLDIDGLQHMESEYGIAVTSSGREQQKISFMKGLGQQMVQSGWSPALIAEIMETENFAGLKAKLKEAEKIQQKLGEAQSKAQSESAQQMMQMEEKKMQNQNAQFEADRQNRIQVAQIQSAASQTPPDDSGKILDERKHTDDVRLKEADMSLTERLEQRKLALDQQKLDNDAAIAAESVRQKDEELRIKDKIASKPVPKPAKK